MIRVCFIKGQLGQQEIKTNQQISKANQQSIQYNNNIQYNTTTLYCIVL